MNINGIEGTIRVDLNIIFITMIAELSTNDKIFVEQFNSRLKLLSYIMGERIKNMTIAEIEIIIGKDVSDTATWLLDTLDKLT